MDIFLYNLRGIYFLLSSYCNPSYSLKYLYSLDDKTLEKIKRRVNYYCNFSTPPPYSKISLSKSPSYAPSSPFKILKKGSRYCYDFYEFMRFFNQDLYFHLESGDVNYITKEPSFCKSRPITSLPSNNIILKLDKKRHFRFLDKKDLNLPYEDKIRGIFFRGGIYQENRKKFMRLFIHHPLCNVGHVGKPESQELIQWQKSKSSISEHLKYKFIASLEGNDVATNLKWIMSSNSIAVSPKLKFETWFMEGTLKPNQHFLCVKEDFSDLIEKIETLRDDEAKEMIHQANLYVKEFQNKKLENLISFLVLKKYFYQTQQAKASPLEEEIFKASQ